MDPYNFMDYRDYVKALMATEKSNNPHFSFRYFARIAGFRSPSYLKMVIDGKRNLTPRSIHQFAKAFKMGNKSAAYFEALVLLNQAKSEREKELYFERLSALRPLQNLKGLEKDQFEYYTKPYFVTIREMAALPHFQEDTAWIAQHLKAAVKPRDIAHAIEVLLRLRLLIRNTEGKLMQCDESLTTPPEIVSMEVVQYHRAMLDEAKEALLKDAPDIRDITSLTLPIPMHAMPMLKQRIQQFREDLLDTINKGSQDFDDVYQLNIQLFPLTNTNAT